MIKKLLLVSVIVLVAFPSYALAITGQDVQFNFELGEPALVADTAAACNDTAVAKFDFVLGEPTIIFDTTANCTAAPAAAAGGAVDDIIWFD